MTTRHALLVAIAILVAGCARQYTRVAVQFPGQTRLHDAQRVEALRLARKAASTLNLESDNEEWGPPVASRAGSTWRSTEATSAAASHGATPTKCNKD